MAELETSKENVIFVAIHVCPPAVFKPVTDRLNEYLLNLNGSLNPYYVLWLGWEHPLELFFCNWFWY